MMAAARTRLLRRLRSPRAGDPTRFQLTAAISCGLFAGLSTTLVAVAGSGTGGARVLSALTGLAALVVGAIPLARALPRWRRAVRASLARDRRALVDARVTPAQQLSTQLRWVCVTSGLAAAAAVPFTVAVALAARTATPELGWGMLVVVALVTVLGAALPGSVAWRLARREIGRPNW